MSVGPGDIGRRVTYRERVGVLRDFDAEWLDPASPPWDRRRKPQAWVKFEGQAEVQIAPRHLERAS